MTTNVPQDVIDDFKEAGFPIELMFDWENRLSKFLQLRDQRAGCEAVDIPVDSIGKVLAEVMELAVANGANSVSMPNHYVEIAGWLNGIKPDTQPQPTLDWTAGMMKAVELAEECADQQDLVAGALAAAKHIRAAIPKESADALKEYVRGKCMEVAGLVWALAQPEKQIDTSALLRGVNSVLEGGK
jgi:hypothetical protein